MKLAARDLRIFATIVDAGGISAAARQLGMPKSSVSRELTAIEARLGTRLIQRSTRHLSLTEPGDVLISYARRIVEELENAEAAVEALEELPSGHLAVTAPYAMVRFTFGPNLPAFLERYPALSLSINPTIEIIDLIENRIDVAIRIGEPPQSTLIARKLVEMPLILAASPAYLADHGHPATPLDLADHSLIELGARTSEVRWRLFDGAGGVFVVEVRPRLAIVEPAVILDLVEQGMGIGILPMVYARPAITAGRLVRVLPHLHCGIKPIHVLYPSRRLLAPKVRAFIDFAIECMGER